MEQKCYIYSVSVIGSIERGFFMIKKMGWTVLLVFLLVIMGNTPALAHRMLVEVIDEGAIKVRYDDGTMAGRARVTFYDEDGQILEEGITNEGGIYYYDLNVNPNRVVADDGMGHRARWVEGQTDAWDYFPRWQRAFFGVAIFMFIAAISYYRKNRIKE